MRNVEYCCGIQSNGLGLSIRPGLGLGLQAVQSAAADIYTDVVTDVSDDGIATAASVM